MTSDSANKMTQSRSTAATGGDDQIDLARLFAMLWGGKWWIFASAGVGLTLAIIYLLITPYSYTTDALLQIEASERSPLGGLAGARNQSLAAQLSGGGSDAALAEIPIIKSRAVLGQTVEELGLTVRVVENKTPIIGALISRGSPKLGVSGFEVPSAYLGEEFVLAFADSEHYTLSDQNGRSLLTGTVGKPSFREGSGGAKFALSIKTAQNVADRKFTISKQPWLSTVNTLKNRLEVSEVEPGSGILELTLEGHDRQAITDRVNSVSRNYVQQNVEARSQDAEQSLEFLNSQLPDLKKEVNEADARLAEYQENHQPVDLSAEGQALLQRGSTLEDSRSQLQLKIAELSEKYTSQYPEVIAAKEQLAELTQRRNELEKQINRLPRNQKDILGLQRDVKVNTQLYTSLLNRAQELRVVKAGTIGNVRIVDPAVLPLQPTSPRPKLVVAALTFLGLLVGVGLVFLRAALRRGVSNPAELERKTGHPVYAVIPFSRWLARRPKRQGGRLRQSAILARDHADDVVVEALRSLRTSLHFVQMESSSNVLMITGPSPGVGKSFLSLNLGYLLAEAGQRVVVVDADMRRGHLHDVFGSTDRGIGLSELILGQADVVSVAKTLDGASLDIITSGTIPPNPSELLMRASFRELVDSLCSQYEIVIIDAPPVLAVTDAGIIASSISNIVSFMVLHSGEHPMQEIDEAIARFARQGGELAGLVLNRYKAEESEAYYGYGHYSYAYSSDSRT